MKFLTLILISVISCATFAARDTDHAKCSAKVLAKDSFAAGQIKKLSETGKVKLTTLIRQSDQYNFGPTIYVHMWHTMKDGKIHAQYCERCYQNRIIEDTSAVDGGFFEFISSKVLPCTIDPNYIGAKD